MENDKLFLYDIYDAIGGVTFSDVIVGKALHKLRGVQKQLFVNLVSDHQLSKLLMELERDFEVSEEILAFLNTYSYKRARNFLLLKTLQERQSQLSKSIMAREISSYFDCLIKWLTGYCDLFEIQKQEQQLIKLLSKLSPDEIAQKALLEVWLLHSEEVFKIDNILKLYMELQWSIKNLE